MENTPQNNSFIRANSAILKDLSGKLKIPEGELDGTIDSLDRLDEAVQRKGRRKCLQPEIYPLLLFYVGEVLKQAVHGQWELFTASVSEINEDIQEAVIVAPNGVVESPHHLVYEQLYEGHTCYIASKVRGAIRRMQENVVCRTDSSQLHQYQIDLRGASSSVVSEEETSASDSENLSLESIPQQAHSRIKEWFVQSIIYYREFSFFNSYSLWSEQQLIDEVEKLISGFEQSLNQDELKNFLWEFYPEALGESFSYPSPGFSDLYLLRWDFDRVWSEKEIETISFGKNEYVKAIYRWAQISRGIFFPQKAKERWKAERGPIILEFFVLNEKVKIQLEYFEGKIDLSILEQINRLIGSTGYKFETIDDDSILVVTLNAVEKHNIEQERKIQFR